MLSINTRKRSYRGKIMNYTDTQKKKINNDLNHQSYSTQNNDSSLSSNIKKILRRKTSLSITTFHSDEKSEIPQLSMNNFNSKEHRNSFINPKSTEPQNKQKCSRIQRQFINTYKEMFIVDGIQGINDNPKAVNSILYSGLCANAIASFKWQSVESKRRINQTRPQCPDFPNYPLSPRAYENIKQMKSKIYSKQADVSKYHKEDRVQIDRLREQIIIRSNSKLNTYLNKLQQMNDKHTNIYGTILDDYNDILEYCDASKYDFNKFDIKEAQYDVDLIKRNKKAFEKSPNQWIQKQDLKEQVNLSMIPWKNK